MKLTRIEIEEIRALVNACKEKLCNQRRWNEAQEYQDIVDKLDELPITESVIRCKDCKYRDEQSANCTRFRKDWYVQSNSFCSWAERKQQ